MKKISQFILATLLLVGCNNVDDILSNFKTKKIQEEIITDQVIDSYKYEDVCNLFFNDKDAILRLSVSKNIFYISINYKNSIMYSYDYNTSFSENELNNAIHSFINNKGSAGVFLIRSLGSEESIKKVLAILNKEYNESFISESERFICILRDEEVQSWDNYFESPPPPPPPPSIPEIIEIIEDDLILEDQIEIEELEHEEIEIIEEDDEEVYMVVEIMPEFPGGSLGLMRFIQENIVYPLIAKEYNITGKVYVSYVVDKSGFVTNVKVVRGVDKNLDAEAIRVIKLLPKYKPGTQRGSLVNVMFTVPINFTLN